MSEHLHGAARALRYGRFVNALRAQRGEHLYGVVVQGDAAAL